eukprot:4160395-Prymnesium_polylepis.1
MAGLAFERSPGSRRRPLRWLVELMAHAYKAIGECAARDFGCDCFSAPDRETKIELFSRSAVRDR